MAEVFDFGLQQHKIKMDGKFFENNLFAVAGDTGRRLEVQLLDSNNMVQNTTGILLRLNANVAGQATYAEATLVDATKGLYELDLPNGMLIAPGNWQFQWQIIGTSGEKLHSFAFTGSVGSNLSEGGSEATNFYLNADELKQMQDDLINGTFNSEVLETNIAEKLNDLEEQYAPKLTEVNAQLAQTINKNETGVLDLDIFDEATRSVILGMEQGQINAVLGKGNVKPENTNFFEISKNLYNPKDVNFLKGKGFSGFTDTVVDNAAANITGMKNINPGEKFFISKNGVEITNPNAYKIIFYKLDGTFRSGQYYVLGGVVMPSDSDKVNIQTDSTAISLQIEKGTAVTSYEAYFEPRLVNSVVPDIPFSKVTGVQINPDETTFIKRGKNLFDPYDVDVVMGGYYNASNVLTVAATHNQSGFIHVTPGQRVTASYKAAFVNWYTKAGDFLGSTPSATFSSQGYVEPVAGSYYARFIATISEWAKFQVEYGQISTSYESYFKQIDSKYLPSVSDNPLKNKRFTSYGDSLAAQEMWQPLVRDYFNLNHTNLGIGSTTVAYVAEREATYPCFTNPARIQAIKDSNPDILTIIGGTNDAHLLTAIGVNPTISRDISRLDVSTFKGGYAYLIETLLTWKPTLEIIIMSPMQSGYMTNPYRAYVDASKDIANFYTLPFVNLYDESGISYYNINTYTSDLLHPNALGGRRIANMSIEKFKMIGTV